VLTLILTYESPSLLEKRFKKTTTKQDNFINDFTNYLLEKMKPLSKKNTTSDYMSKSKKLLLQAGYASS